MWEIMPKIDLKDRKILSELDFNARKTISNIAKKVRLSKEVTLYRIRKLERLGIIRRYYAIINTSKLGYRYYRLLIKFQNVSREIETKILNYLKRNTKIAYLGILDGPWDLAIGFWAKDIMEFKEFINNFIFKYGKYILDKEISIGLNVFQFQHRYLLNKRETQEFRTGGKIESIKVDNTDKKILVLLTENARMSLEEMGKRLHLTGKAIHYRINDLIKKGIIVGFRTWIDYKKFGYSNTKVLLYLKDLTKNNFVELTTYLKFLPNCIYITEPIGKADLEFELLIKDREEFFSIINDLKERFNYTVKSYDHLIIHRELISRFIPVEFSKE